MRDKYSHEVARTLYPFGFYKKFTDAGWRDKARKTMAAQEDPGIADGVFIALGGKAAFIEAKTGDRTSFAFDGWVPRQREFCLACHLSAIPYWIFLIMGDAITSKEYPRVAYLFTGELLFNIIEMAAPRKSLAYATASAMLIEYQLQWKGHSTWEIPEGHPFRHGLAD